ncbi:hypothetical protein [Salicola sp. Rm-C-2C1-2]|uniref:hypothetical protein n=1 Tax=Salicola sp. Rm-C-2C1-2 TaxID=3141321 RepID=UPI0032E3E60A
MSAAEQIEPADVGLPGYMAPTVSQADDETLKQTRADAYKAIRAILEQDEEEPNENGFAPDRWKESIPRGRINNLNVAERHERLIQAVGVELERRESERAEQRQQEQEQARHSLESLLAEAPAKAQALVDSANEAQASVDRIRQLLRDVEVAGQIAGIAEVYEQVARGAHQAAEALGQKAPKLAEMPTDTFSKEELKDVKALFTGRRAANGWDRAHKPGEFAKVPDIKQRL